MCLWLLAVCWLTDASAQGASAAEAKPKRLLLVGQGPDGHPPGTHEYMAGVQVLARLLAPVKSVTTTIVKADEPWADGPALLDQCDAVVLFVTQGAQFIQLDPQRHAALRRLAARQGGITALHWGVGAKDAQYIMGQLELLGGTRGGPQRKYQILETDVRLADPKHPVLAGLKDFRIKDEFYYRLDMVRGASGIQPLLTTTIDGGEEVVCWSWERPTGGRSFGFVGLHFHANWQRSEYRRLVTQGVLWTLGQPIPKDGVGVEIEPAALELKPAK